MKKIKKLSYNDLEFIRRVIQKELDFHGVKFEDIQALPDGMLPDGSYWFHYYTFNTPEQHEEWKKYTMDEIKNCRERLNKKEQEQLFSMIDLTYGLRLNYKS
jgi:hypothetical protein